MKQFDEKGWPVDMTETELHFFHKTVRSLPLAFREACKEIDQLNKKEVDRLEKDIMQLHRQIVSLVESRLAVAKALLAATIVNKPMEYEAVKENKFIKAEKLLAFMDDIIMKEN